MADQINLYEEDYLMTHMDAAVAEVFELMLGISCFPLTDEQEFDRRIMVEVRFSGVIEGSCLLFLGASAGKRSMEALLGERQDVCDSMMMDAVGELCNMIAGSWKSKLDPSMASASLSVPTIIQNAESVISNQVEKKLRRSYRFQGNMFGIGIYF